MSVDNVLAVNGSTSTLLMEPVYRERELEQEVLQLRSDLDESNLKRTTLEDQLIDLRANLVARQQSEEDLRQQLKVLSEFAINQGGSHQKTIDLQRMYDQLVYKDKRIIELNNTIMEKERDIMDLQEMYKEQSQVASAKSLAVQIVNRRLKDLDSRKFADSSTQYTESDFQSRNYKTVAVKREISPGRAVVQLKVPGNGSPPPIDPVGEDLSSYTTETYPDDMDFDRELSASPSAGSKQARKHRKRVTFNFNAAVEAAARRATPDFGKIKHELDNSGAGGGGADMEAQNLAQAVVDLSTENDQLRRTIAEMEKALSMQREGDKIAELEEEAEQARKEGKHQALRARAAAQARIKELETKLLELKVDSSKELENLKAANETLKSSREWTLMENSRLLEQISTAKSKLEDLRGELDASLQATTLYRQRLETEEHKSLNLTNEVRLLQRNTQQLIDEREFYQSEIDRLKETIRALEEFVSIIEGDLIVYEAHVGILRETLGASKKEDRQIIRSKAFNAKLNALELEKQQISKRNSDERIRTKALNAKIRMLEQQRDELILRLKQYEDESAKNLGDALMSTDDEETLANDTKPTFHERDALNVGMEDSTASEPLPPPRPNFEDHADEIFESELQRQGLPKFEDHVDETIGDVPLRASPSTLQPPPTASSQQTMLTYVPDLESVVDEVPIYAREHDNQSRELLGEVERMRTQRTEAIAILHRFMDEICTYLRNHEQPTLADQMESDLRTYQVSPDVDLVIVTTQAKRFIDEVIDSLIHDVSTLRIEKDSLREQYSIASRALLEAQDLKSDVEELREQSTTQTAENRQIPTQFDLEAQTGTNESAEALHGREDASKDEKERSLELKSADLEAETLRTDRELADALASLNEAQKQNTQLEQLVESLRSEADHLRVEAQLSRSCLEDLRTNSVLMMEERDEIERKIVSVQAENQRVNSEHSHALSNLNELRQQNSQLEQLTEALRSEMERLRIEAELSRSCLEDLRNNTQNLNWQQQQQRSAGQAPSIIRPEPQQMSIQQNQQQQPIQHHIPLQQAASSAFVPVERAAAESMAREALQVAGRVQQMPANDQQPTNTTQSDQQPGPSHQPLQLAADQDEVVILGRIAEASQQVASYLQSQSERYTGTNLLSSRPYRAYPIGDATAQTQQPPRQESQTQTIGGKAEEKEEDRVAKLLEDLQQKDRQIEALTLERDYFKQLHSDLYMQYGGLQAEQEATREQLSRKENDYALYAQQHGAEAERAQSHLLDLQNQLDAVTQERDTLRNQLTEQHRIFSEELDRQKSLRHSEENSNMSDRQSHLREEEIARLQHQIVQLNAESQYNAQLANERDFLRQQLADLQSRYENEIVELRRKEECVEEMVPLRSEPLPVVSVNVDFSQQFKNTAALESRDTQTDSSPIGEVHESRETLAQPATLLEVAQHGSAPQFSVAAMTQVVQEQKEILRACIEESVQMESYMSSGIDHLMTLNSELERCAESIKAQVYALNQQIADELSEQTRQIGEHLDSSRLVSSQQLQQLRSELSSTRAENELNLQRIDEVQSTHRTLQHTYNELIERYASLQQSFEELQASSKRTETDEKSTDALLDGSTIDRMCDLTTTIEELSTESEEARKQLDQYQQRLCSLQMMMSTQLNSTHDKLKELKSDEFTALRSSIVSSISEFKLYLLHSFGQLQQELETRRPSSGGGTGSIPSEAATRRELENTERLSRALVLCEKICRDIEEDSRLANEQANSSGCLESMLNRIHEHWRAKQQELAENSRALNEQRHLSEMLEGRLNEAEAQLNFIQGRAADSEPAGTASTLPPPPPPNNSHSASAAANIDTSDAAANKPNLHLAIMAARLTTKQADNDALFRCNSELAHANLHLHAQVENLQECVQRVSEELDAVTNSISSNSRQSSLGSLSMRQQSDDQLDRHSPRRRTESAEETATKEQLAAVREDEHAVETSAQTTIEETSLEATLKPPTQHDHQAIQIAVQSSESASTTKNLKAPKKVAVGKKLRIGKSKVIAQNVAQKVQAQIEEVSARKVQAKSESPKAIASPPATHTSPKHNDTDESAWAWGDEDESDQPVREPTPSKQQGKSKSPIATQQRPKSQSPLASESATQNEWGWDEDDDNAEATADQHKVDEAWSWKEENEAKAAEDIGASQDDEDNWDW